MQVPKIEEGEATGARVARPTTMRRPNKFLIFCSTISFFATELDSDLSTSGKESGKMTGRT